MIHLGADAALAALEVLLGIERFGGLTLKLFTNDREPEDVELASDYIELEGHGYADVALEPDAWIASAGEIVDGQLVPALAVHPKVTWTFKAGPEVAVYGYFVVWTDSQRLAWAERFKRPQWIEFEGDNVAVVPTFRFRAAAHMLPPIQDGVGA